MRHPREGQTNVIVTSANLAQMYYIGSISFVTGITYSLHEQMTVDITEANVYKLIDSSQMGKSYSRL